MGTTAYLVLGFPLLGSILIGLLYDKVPVGAPVYIA